MILVPPSPEQIRMGGQVGLGQTVFLSAPPVNTPVTRKAESSLMLFQQPLLHLMPGGSRCPLNTGGGMGWERGAD